MPNWIGFYFNRDQPDLRVSSGSCGVLMNLLVLHHDEPMREIMRGILSRYGHQVDWLLEIEN